MSATIRARLAAAAVAAAAAVSVLGTGHAAALPRTPDDTPMCAGAGKPRTVLAEPAAFEAVAFDTSRRMLVSDVLGNRLVAVDRPGAAPRKVATVRAPRGIAPLPDGRVLVGSGSGPTALLAPDAASLATVDPRTGASRGYAHGLSMANGVVRSSDGTVYASSAVAPAIDRVGPDRRVSRGWYHAATGNGLALSADGKTLYANVSVPDTRVLAIDTATGAARTYFRPPAGLDWVFFDDLDIDAAGNLYAPLYLGGQVWRIGRDGSHCALAKGLTTPAGISVGPSEAGFPPASVFVTTHAGSVVEIPRAVPATR
ncbi:SMP-30/gluconolactonase/LRE family protein [Gordonia paraffinivorans]|uniref:SMP-30/gluconolactonase/LRE family protein n=1 Tax=Gordonia paraffinivorans TaxID=175628 RepID=UPI00289A0925|nr:SMP-30/gluconolactonase/LRE family protein [Gordonia paraffinivorans]